jgi:hypothetical protein
MFTRRMLVSLAAVAPAALQPTERAFALGAGTSVSGKSRPELGVILLDEVTSTDKTLSAEIVLHGKPDDSANIIATAAFEAPWPAARGLYYDVEAKSQKDGDKGSAFLQVIALPSGETVETASKKLFTKRVLAIDGRFGAYGEPTDVKITADSTATSQRSIDFGFTTQAPGGSELAWKATMRAVQPPGSTDALVIVSSAPAARWKSGGEALARAATASFRVDGTRPTKIPVVPSSDCRFERMGGLLEGSSKEATPIKAGGYLL